MDSHLPRRLTVTLTVVLTVFAFASVAHATFPGENGKIVFTRVHADENADIWTINADGSGLRRLTDNEVFGNDSAYDSAPFWSRDGRRILFARYRPDQAESGIFTVNGDGSGLTQLSRYEGPFAWLPGNRVAFTEWGADAGLYTAKADGTERTRVGPNPDSGLSWSPDGTKFVYERCCDEHALSDIKVFVSSMDGADVREILRVGRYEWPSPTWGPGSRIAFLRFLPGGVDIYTINSDGTGQLQLTADTGTNLNQEWSPDGTKLLFLGSRNAEPGDVFDVFTIAADGTDLTNLTPTSTTTDTDADWSPDGSRVAFATQDRGAGLFAVDKSGMRRTRLTRAFGEEHDRQPDWQPLLRSSFRNGAAFCRAHRAAVGPRQFAVRYAKGRKHGGAFRRCIRGGR